MTARTVCVCVCALWLSAACHGCSALQCLMCVLCLGANEEAGSMYVVHACIQGESAVVVWSLQLHRC